MTLDVTKAIQPKSDQLNADDLLTGPRTIRIREVKVAAGQEQPVWIYFDGDDNKPWKSCKTATRTLAAIWGADASKWIGLNCTIYCDTEVTWGGMKVGGIRVSHMEGLTSPRTLMLTKTRGKKGATVIKPLTVEKAPVKPATPTPELDPTTLFADARENAELGRAKFGLWYKSKSDAEKEALKEISADVTALLDAAEKGAGGTD